MARTMCPPSVIASRSRYRCSQLAHARSHTQHTRTYHTSTSARSPTAQARPLRLGVGSAQHATNQQPPTTAAKNYGDMSSACVARIARVINVARTSHKRAASHTSHVNKCCDPSAKLVCALTSRTTHATMRQQKHVHAKRSTEEEWPERVILACQYRRVLINCQTVPPTEHATCKPTFAHYRPPCSRQASGGGSRPMTAQLHSI